MLSCENGTLGAFNKCISSCSLVGTLEVRVHFARISSNTLVLRVASCHTAFVILTPGG